MDKLPCVILAGGKSRRMGTDKALLPFGDLSLARYQYERLKELFDGVYLSAKSDKFDFNAPLIIDESPIFSPAAAIAHILESMGDFFAIAVDTPFVGAGEIEAILAANESGYDAIVAKSSALHPLIGIYRRSFLPTLRKELAQHNHKLTAILQKAHTKYVEFDDETPFFNCNTPQEFQEALKLLC